MQPDPVLAQVLAEYRKARTVLPPLDAITDVGDGHAQWAMTFHSQGLASNRDVEHAAWQWCNLIADEITRRIGRLDPYGAYWTNGNLRATREVFELYCMEVMPPALVSKCPTLECALKHAVDHLRVHAGCWMKVLNMSNGKTSREFSDALTVHDWADLAAELA